jgi:hypothetical protein
MQACTRALCISTSVYVSTRVKPFGNVWVGQERHKALLISRSETLGFDMKIFLNGLFEMEICSAVFLAQPSQTQTALRHFGQSKASS